MAMNGESRMQYQQVRVISGKESASGQFAEALRGLALDSGDLLHAVGDSALKVFTPDGKLLRSWHTARPGYSIAVAADSTVYVGQPGQLQTYNAEGKLLDTWRDADRLGLVTAIGLTGKHVLLADTRDRCLRRFDRSGKFLNNIGKDNRMRGFLVPNRHLDFAVDSQGIIHAANPGKHRVEQYTLEGKLLGHFGRFDGRDPAGFTGCCNPTNVALTPKGQVVVTVKADPHVKVYDASGKFLAVVGKGDFELACKNMDVAVDSKGRIYVVDTVRLDICVYTQKGPGVTTQPGERSNEG